MTLRKQSATLSEGVGAIYWRFFWEHYIIIPYYRRGPRKKDPGSLDPAYGIGSPDGRPACWAAWHATTRYVVYENQKNADTKSCMYQ